MTHVNIPALAQAAHPVVQIENGQAITLSTEVARIFGKRHDDVLRAIKNLLSDVGDECLRNFAEASVEIAQPNGGTAKYPAYHLTRDGFFLLAFGFNGKRAMAFKCAFLKEFNRMEAELANQAHPVPLLPADTQRELQALVDRLESANHHAVEQANETSARMLRVNESMTQAHELAMQAAYAIARQVFAYAIADDVDIAKDRWVLALGYDAQALKPKVIRIPRDAYILPPSSLVGELQTGNLGATLSNQELSQVAQAALERIAQRAASRNQTAAAAELTA